MDPETIEACYKTLRLTPDAKFNEIKHAYRTLVKHWHPDRFATDADSATPGPGTFSRYYSCLCHASGRTELP